jgi:cytoskeletal protein RodZ
MKYLSLGVLVLVSAASVGAQQYPAPKSDDKVAKDSLTVTGCVGAGTEPNTFILTKSSTAAAAPAAPTTPPTAAAPAADPVIYRLDSPEKVKAHLGHQVEVTGTLDETKAADAKEAAPSTDAAKTAGTSGKQPNLKLKVKEVKMLSGTCS